MLTLSLRNIFTDRDDVADYLWEVKINSRVLASGMVYEHQRSLGPALLLQKVVNQMYLLGFGPAVGAGSEGGEPKNVLREGTETPDA